MARNNEELPEMQNPPEGLAESLQTLYYKIDDEGFDYAMAHYSNWREIKDKNFHAKLDAYCKARKELLEVLMLDTNT